MNDVLTLEEVSDLLCEDIRTDGFRGVSKGLSVEEALERAGAPLEERVSEAQRVLVYVQAPVEGASWAEVSAKVVSYDGTKVSQTRVRVHVPTREEGATKLVKKLRARLSEVHGKPASSRSGDWKWVNAAGKAVATLLVKHSDQTITLVL